ncbi:MAG TPA: hypothetical protein VMS02_05255 [Solirubrobacteraceae bacterium]|nr:hypothetical protein [Solirubrobacteraceae bacterium]
MLLADGVNHDVAQAVGGVDLDGVDRPDAAARLADGSGDRPEQSALGVVELDADRQAVLGAGCAVYVQGSSSRTRTDKGPGILFARRCLGLVLSSACS